ncbi:MAG TPA: zinc-ribbon domain-containing protein [Kofleriaceae bacterium]|nr:zinc-ribbon domain-containing protein [Kofleriaceae bacterium]
MDVRCEKCQTEYELDEGKLKPGGVTVKCTTCGHMFRVRPGAVPHPSESAAISTPMPDYATPAPVQSGRASSILMNTEEGERTWLIRLEDGEIKTCRELSTLQKWIVSGRVSRSCSISRTGKKWKLLGEIGELASFFGIADEARDARHAGQWSSSTREYPSPPAPDGSFGTPTPAPAPTHPRTVPRRSTGDPVAPLHLDDTAAGGGRREGQGVRGSGYGGGGDGEIDGSEEDDETAPASYADALAAEMERANAGQAVDGPPASFARTLPLGGAALGPPTQRSAVHDAVQMKAQPPPSDLPIDDELVASGPVGSAATLPPYGAGMLGTGSPSRSASLPSGLPLAPPPSRKPMATGGPAGPTTGWAPRGPGAGMRDHGPSGPTGGKARGDLSEAAFVGGSKMPNIRGEFENGKFVPSPFTDDEPLIPSRSHGGLWVFLFSLVVMAGAGGAVYVILYKGGDEQTEQVAAAGASDAGAVVAAPPAAGATGPGTATPVPPDVTPPAAPADAKIADEAVALAQAAVRGESPTALASAGQALAGLGSGSTPAPAVLVARARVETALAQQLADRAKLAATPVETKKLTGEAKARARAGRQLAEQALAARADDPAALLAVADARRLEGERSIEVERWLRRAQQSPAGAALTPEVELVTALLRVRDNRLRDARVVLDKLAKAAPADDVRARFRLAWIDHLDGNADAARTGAEAVLKTQADHGGARALLDKLGAAGKAPVETSDPMPPEQKGNDAVAGKGGDKPTAGAGSEGEKGAAGKDGDRVADDKGAGGAAGAGGGDSFDQILDRAQKLADNGNCTAAMPLYRKVLDLHPAAVEALTGLGYCHLDRREYASAHTRFRAALGISSRYQPAMWGIAEAYQQQGMKEEALERFQAFVTEHPHGPRADAARERIANLKREIGPAEGEQPKSGGESPAGGAGSSGSSGTGDAPSSGDSSSPGSGSSGSGSSGSGSSGSGSSGSGSSGSGSSGSGSTDSGSSGAGGASGSTGTGAGAPTGA